MPMNRFVIDTNVPIIANGRMDESSEREQSNPPIDCQLSAILFLTKVLENGKIIVDSAGLIETEYKRHLRPSGQPGVGDRFLFNVLMSMPDRIERVSLERRKDGEFSALPDILIQSDFDQSDRKFAAAALISNAPVVNSTDSDWYIFEDVLTKSGISVIQLCLAAMTQASRLK